MAQFQIQHVRMSGVAACVPENRENNFEHPYFSKSVTDEFIAVTGVEERRIADSKTCTSDLCVAAAERLLEDLQWDRSEIDILIFISQTPDYILPVTSAIVQDRLRLPKSCVAFDMPLGCSGFTYGMSVIAGMMSSTKMRKGLLLVGDTPSKSVGPKDKSAQPLFGDAGAATAFEYDESAPPMAFDMGTDGSGHEAIIIRHGGYRNPTTTDSLLETEISDGIARNSCQLSLEGMDVFSFGITKAPKTVNDLISAHNIDKDSVDYFIFHQANMMMNKMISKKLKLPAEKVPHSLKGFGNTSSATIPLTLVTELREEASSRDCKWVFCGFGVGLSWGTAYVETSSISCPALVEI